MKLTRNHERKEMDSTTIKTIEQFFEIAPKSDQTVVRNHFIWRGWKLVNDLGEPCLYRVIALWDSSLVLGAIKYYRGRLLSCYELHKVA